MCESRVDRPEFLAKVRLQGCTAEKVGFNLTIYSMSGTSPPQLPSLQYCSNTDKFLEAFFHKAQTRILQPGMAMRSLVGKGGAPVMDDVENADGDGENGGVEEEAMAVESDLEDAGEEGGAEVMAVESDFEDAGDAEDDGFFEDACDEPMAVVESEGEEGGGGFEDAYEDPPVADVKSDFEDASDAENGGVEEEAMTVASDLEDAGEEGGAEDDGFVEDVYDEPMAVVESEGEGEDGGSGCEGAYEGPVAVVESDLEDAGEEGGADFVRPIRKGGKQRRIVRETRHPPTPDELGLSRKHRKTQRLQWGVSYSRFKEAGESDCGCELHQQV